MRTTITLEDDVVKLLEAERLRSKSSLKEAINRALRRGLSPEQRTDRKPFHTPVKDLGPPLLPIANIGEVLSFLEEKDYRDSGRR
jgi:hypothetical protein